MELPPFKWPRSASEIEAQAKQVEEATALALDAVAAVPDDAISFDTVIAPLMAPPHFKTNPLVCQAKFMQHCSTDAAVRDAADAAGTKFAALKASGRTRADVYAKVKKFSDSAACQALSEFNAHFVKAIVGSFERSGLGLSAAQQAELKDLRAKDAACCASFKKNLGEDATALKFQPAELGGCDAAWIAERTDAAGEVTITLKYPDLIPVLSEL